MTTVAAFFWMVPVLPLGVFGLLAAGLSRYDRIATRASVAALAGSVALSVSGLLATARGDSGFVSMPWLEIGGRELELALRLDPLSALISTVVSLISLVVFIYAAAYMADALFLGRFFALFSLFAGAMLTLVFAGDLLTLFIAWEIVGLCSYLLIGFWFQRAGVPPAATKAFLVTRVADLMMLAGVLLLVGALGAGRIEFALSAAADERLAPEFLMAVALLFFAGAAGKSAQVPFHGWLPDAMVGPTPVSALIHSATMVAAGVFLVARLYPLFEAARFVLPVIAWIGAITALLGGVAALVQTDLKRTLAYSTMSQLGLMFVALGAGSLIAGLVLLIAQAFYKSTLFLAAGAIDHAVGSTAFERMGGLARRMPFTFLAFIISAAALAGLPVTLALPPKEPTLAAALVAGTTLFAAALLASGLTALYSARMVGLVFFGAPSESARQAHESSPGLIAPALALAIMTIFALLADSRILGQPLSAFFGEAVHESSATTILALIVAIGGIGVGLAARKVWSHSVIWPPLERVATLLVGEFGLKTVYNRCAEVVLSLSSAASFLDRRLFDPVGKRLTDFILALVRRAGRFDRAVFDPVSSKLATGLLAAVQASARFDLARVDTAFRSFGQTLLAVGQRARNLQTGRVENYLLAIFIWSLGTVVLAAIAISMR